MNSADADGPAGVCSNSSQIGLSMKAQPFGRIAAVLCGGMLATAFVSASADDQPQPSPKASEVVDLDGDGVLDAGSAQEAAETASKLGEAVEDFSQRTEAVTVLANPNGTWTREDFGAPVRLYRGGEWTEVDYNLERQADGSWASKASPVDATIGGGAQPEAARVGFGAERSLAVTWPEDLPEPTVDGGVATYRLSEVSDLVVGITGDGLSARIRLNERPAEDDAVFSLGLRAEGATVNQNANDELVVRDGGKIIGKTSQLLAWDSRVDLGGDPTHVVDLAADLTPTGGSGDVTTSRLELTAPSGFLDDPETVYPVTIDPDISSLSRVRDTWVLQGNTTPHGSDYRLVVGNIGTSGLSGDARSYLQFNSSALEDKSITSANLSLYQYYSRTCSARSMTAWPISSAWDPNIVYTNRPGFVQGSGDTTTITANRGFTGCGAGTTEISVKNIVSAWAAGEYPDYGIALAVPSANASDPSYERRFCSFNPDTTSDACYEAGRRPSLIVTYRSFPSTATELVARAGSAVPALAAKVASPDGGSVRAKFVIKQGTTTVRTGFSEYVESGSFAVYDADLPPGNYTVQAWSDDGVITSKTGSAVLSFSAGSDVVAAPASESDFSPLHQMQNSSSSPASASFTPAIPAGHTLAMEPSTGDVLLKDASGSPVGRFIRYAIDASDVELASSLSVSGQTITQTVSRPSGTSFPVFVLPIYEPIG